MEGIEISVKNFFVQTQISGEYDMSIYSTVKNHITKKYPDVMAEYSEWIIAHGNTTVVGKIRAYTYLFNSILGRKNHKMTIKKSEFEDTKRKDIILLKECLAEYDVISFDVFDTLVLRNVERPEDVFEVVGNKLGIEGFSHVRKNIEQSLSDKENYTIHDIYFELEKQKGISKEYFLKEFEIEKTLCRENPYIKTIYKSAVELGKKVIIVSDMYWPKEYLKEILAHCGYTETDDIYVSCDYEISKKDGALFKLISEQEYADKKILHIGDNYNSDFIQAKRNGIKAKQYVSVYEQGKKYRHNRFDKQPLGQSIVHAVINNEIHNGICEMDQYEQFGYIYGGPVVAGYCKYINQKVEDKNIDKLLFVARDANVIYKAYKKFYAKCESEYVYASRNAVAQLAFERYPEYFIEKVLQLRFVDAKTNRNIAILLEETGLSCLLDKLQEVDLTNDTIFTQEEMQKIIVLIYRYKGLIMDAFAPVREAAFLYWKQVIGEAKKVALVDIGWQASTMMCLEYFLNEVCHMGVELYTIHMGTSRSKWNALMLENEKILSYCFSDENHKDMGDSVMYHPVSVSVIEIMFTASHPTLISYHINDVGQAEPVFAKMIRANLEINEKIQNGILKFVEEISQIEKDLEINIMIHGSEVFRSLCEISRQKRYMNYLFHDYRYSAVPCDAHEETMGDIIKRNL